MCDECASEPRISLSHDYSWSNNVTAMADLGAPQRTMGWSGDLEAGVHGELQGETMPKTLKSDPSDVRARNIWAVFWLLFPAEQMSRAELGRRVGLSRMAISEVVGEMTENRLLRETGVDSRSGRGKRSVMLAVDPDGWRIVSIDLTQQFVIRGALVDLCGRIVDRVEIPCENMGDVPLEIVGELCEKLLSMTDRPLLGMGVSVPGVVGQDGTVIRSVNLGWTNVPLRQRIETRFHVPAVVSNDTNMALLGECYFGDCSADSVFIKIGQGVGAAVCVNGEIVEGCGYAAGEIGHVVVDPKGPRCVCGKRGCLEALLSVSYLRERIDAEPEDRTAILSEAGQRLGRALAMTVSLLDLSDVSVFGPPEIVGEAFIGSMREELESCISADYRNTPSLHRCQQGDDLVLRGQAVAVIRGLLDSVHSRGLVEDVVHFTSEGEQSHHDPDEHSGKSGD